MAAFDKLVSGIDVEVEPFAICDVRAGWRLDIEGQGVVTVHYALRGAGVLSFGDGPEIPFRPETIIIVPRGAAQRIATCGATRTCPAGEAPGEAPCVSPAEGLRWLQAGQGPHEVLMACGRVRATCGAGTGVFDLLDAPIVESFAPEHPIRHAFRAMLSELSQVRLGSSALAEALMKQCLILALRRLAERQDARLPWLAALEDRRLSAAVEAMLAHPESDHSVEDLAERAGMSRSTFTARFARAFGRPPHGFLTESRLRRAAHLLETTELPVKAIAARTGYRSRSNFSRAFKALYGIDPNAYRGTAEKGP